MLHVNDMTYRIAGRTLFEGATLHVPAGHKAGLVGRNGTGKTTLFRLIAGEAAPDDGTVAVRPRARLGRVAQEAPAGPRSLLQAVLDADSERTALLAEAETAKDPHRIGEIHTRLADIGAHTAEARAASILAGLGFDEAAQARPLSDFSGGWRMRVALAATLFLDPDLLLLDEPTNHLDLEAAFWLEGWLASFPGTLLLISHDRDLLNRAVEEIVHIEDGKLVRYVGGYDRFERTRRERLDQQSRLQARQQAERQRIQAFIDRFRAQANKARQAQSRIKALARMEPIAAVVEEPSLALRFPAPEELPPPLVGLEDAAAGYDPERPVLRRLNLRIDMDDRVGLLGANGNGKSTLMKLLAGRLDPLSGRIKTPPKLRVGYFAQHQMEELADAATPLAHMTRRMQGAPEAKVRAHLGAFGFGADKADVEIASLSGGEKARLLLALMSRDAPHLMLLDEPTNHLDVDMREALVQALNDFPGAVVMVSHDPHILDLVCDRLWLVADGAVSAFDGDLADYRRQVAEARRDARREERGDRAGAGAASSAAGRKDARRERAQMRAETAPLRKAARESERRLEALGRDKAALEAKLADPGLYDGPPARVTELQVKLAELDRAISETEEQWLNAQEALEAAGAS